MDVVSTARGGAYEALSGTSMATPHVSTVAALVKGRTGLNASGVRSRLTATAGDLSTPGRDTSFGFGRVNLQRALSG